MARKYELPQFLADTMSQEAYERLLRRKAQAHVKRDRQRGNEQAMGDAYRQAIHKAVVNSGGLDAYTGEELDWRQISTYDNEQSRDGGRD